MLRHDTWYCYDIIIADKIFDFFGNVFNSTDIKYVALLPFTHKVMQSAPIELHSWRFTIYKTSVIILSK